MYLNLPHVPLSLPQDFEGCQGNLGWPLKQPHHYLRLHQIQMRLQKMSLRGLKILKLPQNLRLPSMALTLPQMALMLPKTLRLPQMALRLPQNLQATEADSAF